MEPNQLADEVVDTLFLQDEDFFKWKPSSDTLIEKLIDPLGFPKGRESYLVDSGTNVSWQDR